MPVTSTTNSKKNGSKRTKATTKTSKVEPRSRSRNSRNNKKSTWTNLSVNLPETKTQKLLRLEAEQERKMAQLREINEKIRQEKLLSLKRISNLARTQLNTDVLGEY